MRYTTWIITKSGENITGLHRGYGLARIDSDGSVAFGFGIKPINNSNPYRDASASSVKRLRNGAFFVKMPKIDDFMGVGLLLIPESCPYFSWNVLYTSFGSIEPPKGITDSTVTSVTNLINLYATENFL